VSSSDATPDLGALVQELRLKQGMKQAELARQAGLSGSSTLSRLERGEVPRVSLELLEALATALGDRGELHAAADALPAPAVRALAPFWRAAQPDTLRERTTPAVRRVHEGARAEEILSRASQPVTRRVDVAQLVGSLCPPRRLRTVPADSYNVRFDQREIVVGLKAADMSSGEPREGNLERSRFLIAHAVAHISLDDGRCAWPELVAAEVISVDLTCHLLAPTPFLEDALRVVIAQDSTLANPWLAGSGKIVAAVARRLGVPAWVALRRLGEDNSYETYAEDTA